MLWQWSENSKLHISDWMHCLTFLNYSNSNQQRKKPRKLDAKTTGRLAHTTINLDTSCQQQFSAICHNCVLCVHCLPQPLQARKSVARSSFPLATFKDCMASFRCYMNSGANDEMTAEDLTRETCCCRILSCSP